MTFRYQGKINETLKIELFDKELIGSIDLTFLENIEYTNPKIYNLLPDICPFNFSNTVYGLNLNVVEKYRNQGYGTKIIHECEKFLEKSNIKFFFLYRENNNRDLDRFYKKFDFIDILTTSDFILFYKSISKTRPPYSDIVKY